MRHLLCLLCGLFPWLLCAQPYTDMGHEWRAQELWRAKGLFNERDLKPVDEAFARQDLRMLWTYFIEANNGQCGRGRDMNESSSLKQRYTEPEMIDLNAQVRTLAGGYLRQIPVHAKLFGDDIEDLVKKPDTYSQRVVRFKALGSLGSDESIAQLGRFLFDQRNPDKGSKKYYMPPSANEFYAAIWLQAGLGDKSPLGRGDLRYGGDKKLREWWLTSADAAPYREGLVASGVALPPDYPTLPETAKKPLWSKMTGLVSQTGSDVNAWLLAAVLLALAAISIWLAARRRKSA